MHALIFSHFLIPNGRVAKLSLPLVKDIAISRLTFYIYSYTLFVLSIAEVIKGSFSRYIYGEHLPVP